MVVLYRHVNSPDHFKRNVRYYFNALPSVPEVALARNNRLINAPGRHIVGAGKICAQKALVIPHVLVAFHPVVQHEHFAVLRRVHRPRIHIHIRVNLNGGDFEPPRLKDFPDGRRRNALPDARHHASDYENIFRLH